ncbi:TITAN-like protein [Arachis hypogaea]|nr:TITAN-like protein [Arachis hypogaea]
MKKKKSGLRAENDEREGAFRWRCRWGTIGVWRASVTAKMTSKTTTNNNENEKKKKKKKNEFEFCKVCKLNHNQGLRHKYFPNHNKSLSNFLSRFRNKLTDVRFFLKNPKFLSPQFASQNRFWCVFCDVDIVELHSSFACANGIRHLASAEHVKNLKHFFWKNGGSVDQLDAFMVSDDDVAKWEKKCEALQNEAVSGSGGCRGAVIGPSSDIHNQPNNGNIDSFENFYSHSVKSYPSSNDVLPLQYYTNENQISGLSGVHNAGVLGYATSVVPLEASSSGENSFALQDFVVDKKSHFSGNKGVLDNGRMLSRESSHHGLQMLTQISSVPSENAGGNVHSGAPPPWFEATEGFQIHSIPVLGGVASNSNMSGKSKKLNPKRVGAAWAEKRKIELEREKRGEVVRNEYDPTWLPNFGRVWQSGSRKESQKEFKKEKRNLFNVETQSEMPLKIQPYVSKRMRMEGGGDQANG